MKKIFFLVLFFISLKAYPIWNYGTIHIFGDSHSAYSFTNLYNKDIFPPTPKESEWPLIYEKSFFDYQNENELLSVPFSINWISRCMHMVGKLGIEVLDFQKHEVKNGDIVLLHFGGVDFYNGHVETQYLKGRDLNEIVESLAQNLVEAAVVNRRLYEQLTVIIMGVIPPCIFAHNKDRFVKQITHILYEEFIVSANRMLNNYLAHYAKINNFLYLNVNHLFEDWQGILRHELSDGQHHVRPCYNYLIKQNLIKLILEECNGFF